MKAHIRDIAAQNGTRSLRKIVTCKIETDKYDAYRSNHQKCGGGYRVFRKKPSSK